MGEREFTFTPTEGTLFFNDENGNRVTLCPITGAEIIEPAEPVDPKEMQYIPKLVKKQLEATFVIRLRQMSRKKFIKKLMGHGVQRNEARRLAKEVVCNNNSYAGTYLYNTLSVTNNGKTAILNKGD